MKRVITMKVFLITMMGALLALQSMAQDTTALTGTVTLDQCISIAIKNNLQVNENGFVTENSRIYLMQARGNFLPTLSANIGHSLSEGRVINSANNTYATQSSASAGYGLTLGLTLWNAGSIRNYAAASQYTYEASKMDLQQQKDNISIQVILSYLQVLSNEEQLTAAKQQVQSLTQQVDKSNKQNELGALTNPAELSTLKGSLASAELSVINFEKAVESAKIALLQYLNLPYSENFELEKIDASVAPAAYDVNSDAIYQQALQNVPIIRSGYLKTLSAQKNLLSAKGQLYPTLSFGANASSNYSSLATEPTAPFNKIHYFTQLGNNFGSNFSINLYIPILNGFQAKGRVQLAQVSLNQAKFEEKTNKTVLQQNVKQAYINVNSGYSSYNKIAEAVKSYEDAARIAQVRFNEGVTTAVEYIVVKTSADRAALDLIASKYDYVLRTKLLDYYQGKLTFK